MSSESPWSPVGTGSRFRVVLLKFTGEPRHSWEASLELLDDEKVILRAIANRQLSFDTMTIQLGDVVVQYFPRKDWYYVQEYLTPSGHLKGWYCNIAFPPRVEASTLTTRDLIVDLFVWPDGRYKVLDMNELETRKSQLEAGVVEKILEAKAKLIQMIERRESPFHLQPSH